VPLQVDTRYPGYAPLYHLLPLATLRRFDLPALKRTTWPSFHDWRLRRGRELPWDFESRFGAAFAHHVWPLLNPGVPAWSLSNREPIRLLAHNLDFWVPYIDLVARERRSTDERCRPEDEEQTARLQRLQAQAPAEYRVHRPLMGGWVWMGEEEAWEATGRLVDVADQHGGLRGLIEAVRRHRIEDDFSDRWSWAKEDFERKVYRKRSRIKTVFVELGDTIPVIGPESEVHEDLLWEDFLALLDRKGRRIVVCLRSGATRATDIAKELGYANHSPVSKALARIRQKALRYLSE